MKTSNKVMLGLTVASIAGKIIDNLILPNNVKKNTQTSFNLHRDKPVIDPTAFVHPVASIIGKVNIGKTVFVGPFASIRGDEGLRIHISNETNIQDGVVLHGLKNFDYTSVLFENAVYHNGEAYSIYINEKVSLAHQCQIHGPVKIDKNVFVGMQSFIFDSNINENVVIEPCARVIGVTIPSNRYVAAGKIVTSQEEADQLPEITPEYRYANFNKKVVDVNTELARGYNGDKSNGNN
ncbi:LbetaH domain-containing protein [Litchfieldia alkalitelluris]|uniref:carbonic anhydrase n=1 Tax=Litchfieldia alkalitelluris TaxID=304268 RepID=UPI0009983548|nr:carbonic anhydrase [Litchfieldia alkalitelluris]